MKPTPPPPHKKRNQQSQVLKTKDMWFFIQTVQQFLQESYSEIALEATSIVTAVYLRGFDECSHKMAVGTLKHKIACHTVSFRHMIFINYLNNI